MILRLSDTLLRGLLVVVAVMVAVAVSFLGARMVIVPRDVYGTTLWTSVEFSWTAGPETREEEVRVRRDSTDNPDVHISGNAWIDDVTRVPQTPRHRQP